MTQPDASGSPSPAPTLVIGVGNRMRRDDGVGPWVLDALARRRPAGVRFAEQSGEGAGLMACWSAASRVILLDAVCSGSPPGTVHRLDAHAERIPSRFFNYSTHAFSVAEAVEMSRVLQTLPDELIIYGIEGLDFGAGQQLSPVVQEAADHIVRRLSTELSNRAESLAGGTCHA